MIVSEQSPARLLEVRGRLYELLVHAIPASLIFKTLAHDIVRRVDESLRASIIEKAAFYVRIHFLTTGTAMCVREQAHIPS